MKKSIKVRLNVFIVLLHILCSFLFVAAGYFFITNPYDVVKFRGIYIKFVGLVSILFFGFALIVNVFTLFRSIRALAVANEDGLYIYDLTASWGKIEWEDIEDFELRSYNGFPYIAVNVVDFEKYFERLRPSQKVLSNLNKGYNFKIGIKLQQTTMDPEVLCNDLNEYREKIMEDRKNKML